MSSAPHPIPGILVAPDSFKGTFGASAVADAIARGIQRTGFSADRCPVADGGEGTMAAVLAATGGRLVQAKAHDPLGREIETTFALLDGDRCALVETAAASGLGWLADAELDPWRASSYGTGELISSALDTGVELVLVAVGGSGTVDGGSGALQALAERPAGIGGVKIVVLSDVQTCWDRCAEVYGPQKGADAALVRELAARLDRQARALPRDPRGVPATGAGGGLSGALWARYGATLEPGAARVLDTVGFDQRLQGAIAVISGEGKIDAQSAEGKVISEIARRARRHGVALQAIVGRCELDDAGRRALGIDLIAEATTLEAIEDTAERIAVGCWTKVA